jgi:hypothetical protein
VFKKKWCPSNLTILLISPLPFRELFAPAHTATVNLHEVKQQSTEDDVEFYAHVISIIDKLELLLPSATRHPAAAAMPAQIIVLEGYDALPAAVQGTIPTIF